MRLLLAAVVGLVCTVSDAQSAEYYGTFSADGPEGQFRQGQDRPEFTLSKLFYFDDQASKRWEVPQGITVNGASIPQVFWSIIGGPFEGDYLNASVIHDHFFITKTESSDDTHRVFYHGMLAKGVPTWKAKAMYWAVSTFNDKWEPRQVVVPTYHCVGTKCTVSARIVTKNVVTQSIDLSDPELAALAVSKFNAIVRTLKTTDGGVLDVSSVGEVNATPDSIESNANHLREVFATKAYRLDPEALGVLSDFKIETLDAAPKWDNGVLPKFSTTPTFEIEETKPILRNQGYKLGTDDINKLSRQLDLSPKTFDMPRVQQ